MREKDRKALEALARARPGALDPTRLAGSPRQQSDLIEVMSAQSTRSTRSARSAYSAWTTKRRVLVPLVGLGAAVAVGVGAVALGITPNHNPTTSAAAGPDGHLVLLSMANTVQNQPSSGPYWQIESQNRYLSLVPADGTSPYVVADTSQSDWSIGVLPGEQSLLVSGINETRGPWASEDTHRWVAAGSPSTVNVDAGGNKATKSMDLLQVPVGGGKPSVDRTDYNGKILALGPNNVSYADLQQLPSDQTQLAELLTKLSRHDGGGSDQSDWMFQQIGNLITFPVSSAVRASAYRILAGLPGITSLGAVTDPLGRGGVGVALPAKQYSDLGVQQQQLIVDPATSTILSQQTVLVSPSSLAASAGLKSGTVLNYQATTHIGWTDQPAAVPTHH